MDTLDAIILLSFVGYAVASGLAGRLTASRIAEPFLLWHAWLPAGVFDPVQSLVSAMGVPLSSATMAPTRCSGCTAPTT